MKSSKITSIPFSEDPIEYLAQQLINKYDDIFIANKVSIILPSRRAVRNLKATLLNLSKDKVCFLPQIITYSDLPSNLILFNSLCENLDTRLPDVLDSFSLELIILEIIDELGALYPSFKTFQDKKISSYLKKFFIKLFTYNQHPIRAPIANHEYDIFNYLIKTFNDKLHSLNKVTEQQLRNIAISRLESTWNDALEGSHIYAILPPTNVPYVLRFLNLISTVKNSEIIIHGFDHPIKITEWEEISEKHSRYFIKTFLNYINLPISKLNLNRSTGTQVTPKCFKIIEAKNEIEEAKQIALSIIDHFKSDIRIGIVTENRVTAKLIKENLKKYNIEINDTVAKNLINLNEIKFFILIFELAITSNLDKIMLLSFLKHPLIGIDIDEVEDFEINELRTTKTYKSLSEIADHLKAHEKYSSIIKTIKIILDFRSKIFQCKSFHSLLAEHLRYFSSLITDRLFPSIDYLNNLSLSLKTSVYALKPIKIRHYQELLIRILSEQPYRDEEFIEEIRLLTPLEARLQKFDVVIIASLNEGEFPNIAGDWPLIDTSLAQHFNFPNYQEPLGFCAYDFESLTSNKEVILSRALHSQGRETIESRFLSQLRTIHKIEHIYYKSPEDLKKIEYKPALQPNPKPPMTARPKKFSVSAIERLIHNPYVYYAKYILCLTPLEDLNVVPSRKDFGIHLHNVLSKIFTQNTHSTLEEFTDSFLNNFRICVQESNSYDDITLKFWLKRIERLAPWLYDYEKIITANCKESLSEKKKEIFLDIGGEKVCISAIFDRVLFYEDGSAKIIDYKTGYTPTQIEVDKGLSPQFPIENLILTELLSTNPITQEYIELKGKKDIANAKPIKVNPEITSNELLKLLTMFLNSDQGYFASTDLERNQKFREYRHLISLNLE